MIEDGSRFNCGKCVVITVNMDITCRTCGEIKTSTFFWHNPSAKSGYQTECKPCMTARNKRWHKDHAEEMKPRFNAASRRMRQTDPLRCLLYQAKARAKKKGCEFDLDIAKMLMPERCPILGIKLESSMGTGTGRFRDCSPSIDRIDNSLGYTQDNVVIISWRANRLKGDASLDELRKIADFYSERATAAA